MSDEFAMMLGGLFMGAIIVLLVFGLMSNYTITLNQETAHDICVNLTGNKTVEASSENGKLICKIPSYDHTTNIIVKTTAQEQNK